MEYLRIHLNDEVPEFGPGHRYVLVVSSGPKYVKLLTPADCETATLARESGFSSTHKRMMAGFDELSRRGKALELDAPAMVERLLKNAEAYDRWTGPVRDALLQLGCDPARLPRDASAAAAAPVGGNGRDEPTVALDGERAGDLAKRLWLTGKYSPEDVVGFIHASFPKSKADRSHINWYVRRMIRDGVESVPPWPTAK